MEVISGPEEARLIYTGVLQVSLRPAWTSQPAPHLIQERPCLARAQMVARAELLMPATLAGAARV